MLEPCSMLGTHSNTRWNHILVEYRARVEQGMLWPKLNTTKDNIYGRILLWWAADNEHKAVVKLLLDTAKVDPDAKDNYDQTLLSWAADNGYEAVVKLL